MREEPFPRDEELGEIIGAIRSADVGPEPDPAFRDRLLGDTRARVRERRRRFALARAAAAVALFAAGWLLGARSAEPPLLPSGSAPPVAGPPALPLPAPRTEPAPALPPRPADLERALADADPAERRAALRRAGDAWLGGARIDPSAALHCYQELLGDRPRRESLEIANGDSWLLKALKVARR